MTRKNIDRRDDEERDERVEEVAVGEAAVVDREGEVAEVRLAADGGDQRRDDVLDERVDDGRERGADDDRDGEVDEVPAQDEAAEFLEHRADATLGRRMDLSLFFAGTAGSVPTARRGLPATLLRRGGDRMLFDCGEGTQRQLLRSVGLPDTEASSSPTCTPTTGSACRGCSSPSTCATATRRSPSTARPAPRS